MNRFKRAHNGKRRSHLAATLSCSLAGYTSTRSNHPWVSTDICRLFPLRRLCGSKPTAPFFRRLYGLAIDNHHTRVGFTILFNRIWTRTLSLICRSKFRSNNRRQKAYTASQSGKSCGSIRHWQPVRAKYNSALSISRRPCWASRPCFFFGSSDSINCHCLSLRSVG